MPCRRFHFENLRAARDSQVGRLYSRTQPISPAGRPRVSAGGRKRGPSLFPFTDTAPRAARPIVVLGLIVYPGFFSIYLSMLNKAQTKFVWFSNYSFLFTRST